MFNKFINSLKEAHNEAKKNREIVKRWEEEAKLSAANRPIRCPKCYSEQLSANKKGFSATKAIAGTLLFPGVGLLAGCHSKNKITITCLRCGHSWSP